MQRMRLVIYTGIMFLALAILLAPSWVMSGPTQDEKEVEAFLNAYARIYEKKDLEGTIAMYSSDPKTVFVDSTPRGRYVGKSAIKARIEWRFKQIVSMTIDYPWVSVSTKGDLAWFVAELLIRGTDGKEKEFTAPARWTGVLQRQAGKWLILQSHVSYTAGAE